MIDFNKYLREATFTKTVKLLRGDVPHVNTLAILTAQNPMGKASSAAENNKRNKALLRDLKTSNFAPIKVGNAFIRQLNAVQIKGKFLGNIEDSFIIPHITRDISIYLARKYEQLAVIWGEKKQDDENGSYIHFQWIEATNPNDTTQPYITTQTRDIVIAGEDASSRTDNFSAIKMPDKGVVPDTHKMVIPFFDPTFEKAKYGKNKKSINLGDRQRENFYLPFFDDVMAGLLPDIEISEFTFLDKKQLPDTSEVHQAIESINNKVDYLAQTDLSGKAYWAGLGSLNEQIKQLKSLI